MQSRFAKPIVSGMSELASALLSIAAEEAVFFIRNGANRFSARPGTKRRAVVARACEEQQTHPRYRRHDGDAHLHLVLARFRNRAVRYGVDRLLHRWHRRADGRPLRTVLYPGGNVVRIC